MIIERTTLAAHAEELRPMFQRHWNEIGMAGTHGLELSVDEYHYQQLFDNGMYLALILKTDEGKIIGYLSIIIYGHPHHQNTNFAAVDCFMIEKGHRNLNGFKSIVKMFKTAEEIVKNEYNVKYFQFAFSVNNPLGTLAKRLGFVESDILMVKKLEK